MRPLFAPIIWDNTMNNSSEKRRKKKSSQKKIKQKMRLDSETKKKFQFKLVIRNLQ